MEDAIFGVNSDFYIREVSTAFVFLFVFLFVYFFHHSEQTGEPIVICCNASSPHFLLQLSALIGSSHY